MKILTKNINIQKQIKSMGKWLSDGEKIEKLAITMTNMNCMLYQNYVTTWSKIKKDMLRREKSQLSLE